MINPRIQELIPYSSKTMARAAEVDPDVVNLSIGEPDFGPPPALFEFLRNVVDADRIVADLKRYEQTRGSAGLRTAVGDYYFRNHGLSFDPAEQILITHGGVGALTLAILTTTSPGDEVLVTDPSYMLYERQILVLGRTPRRVARAVNDGFAYDLEALAQTWSPRAKALIVNSPENPTGYVCSDREMRDLVAFCGEQGMWLIHDEVYDQHVFGHRHVPAATFATANDNVVLVNSLSKKFGVPGIRIGWLAGSAELVAAAGKVHDYSYLAVSRTAEMIGEAMLRDPGVDGWFEEVRRELAVRFADAVTVMNALPGFDRLQVPAGGLFLFPRVAGLAADLRLEGASAGDAVSAWLLRELKIATVPGGIYGSSCRDRIRLVVSVERERLNTALERLTAFAKPPAVVGADVAGRS